MPDQAPEARPAPQPQAAPAPNPNRAAEPAAEAPAAGDAAPRANPQRETPPAADAPAEPRPNARPAAQNDQQPADAAEEPVGSDLDALTEQLRAQGKGAARCRPGRHAHLQVPPSAHSSVALTPWRPVRRRSNALAPCRVWPEC